MCRPRAVRALEFARHMYTGHLYYLNRMCRRTGPFKNNNIMLQASEKHQNE